ncbi:MAG: hypothetical protein GY936_19620 [Ignavibacteriae bacterium]|nr:hypothetical protein [Ignavibacteriota bacterium]
MRNKYLIIIMLILSSLLLHNCSEVEDEIVGTPILEGVHSDGFADMRSDNFHSFKLQASNWNLEGCKKCHAADFTGGTANVSCLGCHTGSAGPEACNTCHGVFADETRIAPPTDLANNLVTTAKGVGAHTSHIYENDLSLGASCFDCHPGNVNDGNYVQAHIDGLPAEISLAGYNNMDNSCGNTYCHGNFEFSKEESESQWAYTGSVIIGNNFSPKWTQVDNTQAACGTCHLLPPTGHINAGNDETAATCINCHAATFEEDGSLNKFTHIDGKKTLN